MIHGVVQHNYHRTDQPGACPRNSKITIRGGALQVAGILWVELGRTKFAATHLVGAQKAARQSITRNGAYHILTKLMEKEPLLHHYHNQAFFDNIVNHWFTPGDMYEMCHKGLSPLAFLTRTFADMHEDKMEDDYYQEATVKTIRDVRKHHTKGPPPLPANDADQLHLNHGMSLYWRCCLHSKVHWYARKWS